MTFKTLFVAVLLIASSLYSSEKPNIILFMTDDMGIECLSTYGADDYKTPVLDQIAEEGIKFNHAYSQPLCTPSRVKIMTGRYNFRNYTKFKHLDPNQKTFGYVAKTAGYKTAVAGKWQLDANDNDDFSTKFGFDSYCLWYFNQSHFGPRYKDPKLFQDGKKIGQFGEYGPDLVNDFALDFIEKNKEEKFFLYYPMILPHYPFEATPDSNDWNPKATKKELNAITKKLTKQEKLERRKRYYIDMVQYADKLVGKVLNKVKELGLDDNTIIMFTSDNGTFRSLNSTWQGGTLYPGGKGRLDNTGNHVPFVVRWPSTIKAGQVTDNLVDFSDFMATVKDLTGGSLPKGYEIDGQSLLPFFKSDKSYQPRQYTFCSYDPKWGSPEVGIFARTKNFKVYGDGGPIYYIANDYFENKPLDSKELVDTQEVKELKEVIKEMHNQGANIKLRLKRKGFKNNKKGKK